MPPQADSTPSLRGDLSPVTPQLPEVQLEVGTQIIGDLHLDIANEQHVLSLQTRLQASRGIPRLVILGDLFEYWVGPAQLDSAQAVLSAMRALVDSGTAIDIIPGNRDFLLEKRFEERSGASVRSAGFVGLLAGGRNRAGRVLLIHGDELCTLDVPYQRLRRALRSRPVRLVASAIPGPLARMLADKLRGASRQAIERKPDLTMQQQESACLEMAAAQNCGTLVCGHAHRFRDDRLGGDLRWLVVDAFGGQRDTLEVSRAGKLDLSEAKADPT